MLWSRIITCLGRYLGMLSAEVKESDVINLNGMFGTLEAGEQHKGGCLLR